jgi:colanic acid biosynthesis glycosyl transferase WcaI
VPLRVIVLTHYFPPEVGAPQARLFELARRLVAQGVQVTVVTGFPNYPSGVVAAGYRGRFAMREDMRGVTVLRTWVFATPNKGFARRLVNHFSFAVSSLTALRRAGPADVIFVESPPLAIGLAAFAWSWIKRAPFIFNVSDIWPQSAVEMGALRNRAAIGLAEWLERSLYRHASKVSVVTPGIVDKLAARGVPREKLFLLTNAVDTDVFRPDARDEELAVRLGVAGRKVFLYAGTHGLAQGLDVVLEAARLTRDPSVLFVLAGEGADKARLEAKARTDAIANVQFLPNQPREAMPRLINLAYATVIPLRRLDVFKAALPSKMFESMAAERPIVLSVWGEAATLVEDAGCGVVVEPENAAALAAAVERLAADPTEASRLGANGRRYALEHFDRNKVAERFLNLLKEVSSHRSVETA